MYMFPHTEKRGKEQKQNQRLGSRFSWYFFNPRRGWPGNVARLRTAGIRL